eukprot:GHVT01047584.1.p1 GENE.GHVT01047584.1~~GHVT01047584.1.p1  ORF type:complete len:518 (+),score=39.43 GHVT01047584.1:1226-2779(+)
MQQLGRVVLVSNGALSWVLNSMQNYLPRVMRLCMQTPKVTRPARNGTLHKHTVPHDEPRKPDARVVNILRQEKSNSHTVHTAADTQAHELNKWETERLGHPQVENGHRKVCAEDRQHRNEDNCASRTHNACACCCHTVPLKVDDQVDRGTQATRAAGQRKEMAIPMAGDSEIVARDGTLKKPDFDKKRGSVSTGMTCILKAKSESKHARENVNADGGVGMSRCVPHDARRDASVEVVTAHHRASGSADTCRCRINNGGACCSTAKPGNQTSMPIEPKAAPHDSVPVSKPTTALSACRSNGQLVASASSLPAECGGTRRHVEAAGVSCGASMPERKNVCCPARPAASLDERCRASLDYGNGDKTEVNTPYAGLEIISSADTCNCYTRRVFEALNQKRRGARPKNYGSLHIFRPADIRRWLEVADGHSTSTTDDDDPLQHVVCRAFSKDDVLYCRHIFRQAPDPPLTAKNVIGKKYEGPQNDMLKDTDVVTTKIIVDCRCFKVSQEIQHKLQTYRSCLL